MKYKLWAAALVAVLVAAAFFLPEQLLIWGDRQRVDHLRVEIQGEAREGFAESLRLTVPEKLMLLRSGQMTVMELDQAILEDQGLSMAGTGEIILYSLQEASSDPAKPEGTAEDLYNEAAALWSGRLTAAREEFRFLEASGGLPEVWGAEGPLACIDGEDLLYLDPETRMGFQAYRLTLLWQGYAMNLLVDAQSGRILSFSLAAQGKQPVWSSRGASGFAGAWLDYWELDSVAAGWYSDSTRSILEDAASLAAAGGSGAAEQITFLYDGLSLSVPLSCQGSPSRYISHILSWNQ